jgi:hypothetical protein
MPNLDEHFETEHYNATRFHTDFPDGVAWTIEAVSFEEMRDGNTNRKKKEPVLWFKETDKYIILNSKVYEVIRAALGPDSDGWAGARVMLEAIDGQGFGGKGYGIRCQGVTPPPKKAPPRIFGPKVAAKLTGVLNELGSGLDQMTAWLRRNEPDLFQHAAGKELPDWLDPVLPACQRYCAELRKARATAPAPAADPPPTPAPAPSAAQQAAQRMSPVPIDDLPDDDIPF